MYFNACDAIDPYSILSRPKSAYVAAVASTNVPAAKANPASTTRPRLAAPSAARACAHASRPPAASTRMPVTAITTPRIGWRATRPSRTRASE